MATSPKITQEDVNASIARINRRRAAGIEAPLPNKLMSIPALEDALKGCDTNVSTFEKAIDKENTTKRELRALLAKQRDIQGRLSKGEYVEGYSPPRD